MKRLGLFLLGLCLTVAAVQLVPCSPGTSLHACCEKGIQASIANPYTTCCESERAAAPAAALSKSPAPDFQLTGVWFIADSSFFNTEKSFEPVRFHWPGPQKNPFYITHQHFLL